ncbi:ER membrane protein complex subunit 1 [Hypsizygus marmoreus]|uniref:ER membrane protein complex subunit 1 n=1 Tax=Hypsizygus marmoreus TaxID=39966 RepID=A0A369JBX6_HYPMA|nr:ER membrane protein complex subunit 1 [Hypsizygus marmoreus]
MWQGLSIVCASLVLLTAPVRALHESDVGVVDWHKLLVGVPLVGAATTAPVFHTVTSTNTSLILTATGSNVLAALDPDEGSVLWRYVYEPDDRIAGFYKHDDVIASLSGPGGSTLRLFEASTGLLTLEQRLRASELGTLSEPHHLGTYVAFAPASVYALANGYTVTNIDTKTGKVLWTWSAPDQGSLTINTHLISTPAALYVVGISKSFASLTLHLTALDPQTGTLLAEQAVPSTINDFSSLLPLSTSTSAHIAWLEYGLLKYIPLTPGLNTKPRTVKKHPGGTAKAKPFEKMMDIGLGQHGLVLVLNADGEETLVGLDGEDLKEVWTWSPESAGDLEEAQDRTGAIWAANVDAPGDIVLSRVFWSYLNRKAKVETFKFPVTGLPSSLASPQIHALSTLFEFDTNKHGIISHASLSSSTNSLSLLLTTTTGTVQLWSIAPRPPHVHSPVPIAVSPKGKVPSAIKVATKVQWTREESLAEVVVAEFVELPESVGDIGSGAGREGESFLGRVRRQAGDAKNFPHYLLTFLKRFSTGSYASPTSAPPPISVSPSPNSKTPTPTLTRDAFGFRQILVAATRHGTVFGIDSSNGNIVWSRVLGLGWAAEVGASVMPGKMFVFGDVEEEGDAAGKGKGKTLGGPQVVIVAQRRASNSLIDTVIFHIDALTGADASSQKDHPNISADADPELAAALQADDGTLEGIDIISGPIVEAFLLSPPPTSSPSCKAVLLLDEYLQVYLYPSTPATQALLKHLAPSLHFPLRINTPSSSSQNTSPTTQTQKKLQGHSLVLNPNLSADRYVAHPTWTFSLPSGEDVKAMIPAHRGVVASLGKVLGNRTTLYKYLNPRLFVLITAPRVPFGTDREGKEEKKACGIYVLDAAKGSVVYRAAVPLGVSGKVGGGVGVCDVKATLVENWLVYHYYDEEYAGTGQTKGWRVVSVELYEGRGVDDKRRSSDMSAYSNNTVDVLAFEQSYVFPQAITAMAPTSTKFGMTVKDLIVATRNNQVQSISRRLLDPRRPNRKVTAEEQEEFLVPYNPVLPYDPHRVLSHNYEVTNVHRIITAPALLESTSLVFAYGLDMFLTRVAPSRTFDVLSENFNKVQLVLTVSGLALAIMFTKPMVRRKRLREKWYQ